MVPAEWIAVEVACSPQRGQVDVTALQLPPGSTVEQAVVASGLLQRHPGSWSEPLRVGIWGRPVLPGQVLEPGDRVEIYRALTVDPKEARRVRYRAQGVRGRSSRVRGR